MIKKLLIFEDSTDLVNLAHKLLQLGINCQVTNDRKDLFLVLTEGELLIPDLVLTNIQFCPGEIRGLENHYKIDQIIYVPAEGYDNYRLIVFDFGLEEFCNFSAGYEPAIYDYLMWKKYVHNQDSDTFPAAEFFALSGPELVNTPFGENEQ